jgi:hypothetical protein
VKPEPQKPGPATPLAEITLDLNGDGVMDKATLMAADNEPAALHLFLGRRSGSGVAFDAPVIKPDLVFNGAMAGQHPFLIRAWAPSGSSTTAANGHGRLAAVLRPSAESCRLPGKAR